MNLRGGARLRAGVKVAGARLSLLFALPVLGACNINNPGVDPPRGVLSYPVALVLSADPKKPDAAPKYLYVANSNFDIRFNQGSLQSYDVAKIIAALKDPKRRCLDRLGNGEPDGGVPADAGMRRDGGAPGEGGVDAGADAGPTDAGDGSSPEIPPDFIPPGHFGTPRGILCDGRDDLSDQDACCFSTNQDFLTSGKSELLIDSYATGIALRDDGARLYVPIRSRNKLLYVEANADGSFDCGGGKDEKHCSRGALGGPTDDTPKAATQATAVAVGTLGQLGVDNDAKRAARKFVATVHQAGQMALYTEASADAAPVLQDVSPSGNLRGSSITVDPVNHVLYGTSTVSSGVIRMGIRLHNPAQREELVAGTTLNLVDISAPTDLRDFGLSPTDSTLAYALIRGAEQSILYVRLDPRLATGGRTINATRLAAGPSKLTQTVIDGHRLLLVSCYDSRTIFIVDEESREVQQIVRGLSGPFEMAVDPVNKLMFITDFGASVLRVVDMRGVVDRSYPPPRIVATLGKPHFAGSLK